MTFKDNSVIARDIKAPLIHSLYIAEQIFERHGVELVITSLNDGKHMEGSKHYSGEAFDIRRFNIPSTAYLNNILTYLKSELGKDYDVVLEKDHIHVEYDPKS